MEAIIEFIQIYIKEVFALFVPLLGWILNNIYHARAKLQLAEPHRFTYLIQEPLRDADGSVIRSTQTAQTASHILTNAGKKTATNVEVVFNWKPRCINVWPSRHYVEHTEQDNRYVMIFESLAPNEQVIFELLSVNSDIPALLNARSDQCQAKEIAMYPQPIAAQWQIRLAATLLFLGLAFAIYIAISILQYLILPAK